MTKMMPDASMMQGGGDGDGDGDGDRRCTGDSDRGWHMAYGIYGVGPFLVFSKLLLQCL
jgi:hypothetical protein